MKIRTIIIICMVAFCSLSGWGQMTWYLTKTMTATLENNVLTVSTSLDAEKMSDYDWSGEIWSGRSAEIHSVVIKNGITDIFGWAFAHTPNLKAVTIGGTVEYIGGYAFYNCGSLESVQLSEGLLDLGQASFKFCPSLKTLDIPASVTSLGTELGVGCTQLEAINVHADNLFFSSEDGIVYNRDKTTLIRFPEGKSADKFDIPGTVKIIESIAFYCSLIENISIPNSVEEMRDGSFLACNNLKSITIPQSVKTIGAGVFGNCKNLTSIQVHAGNADFTSEDDILYNKDKSILHSFAPGKTGDFIVPSFVTTIHNAAFFGSAGLTSITIPNTLTEIGGSAFLECTSLTSITIPYSVKKLGSYVLSVCTGLKEITVQWKIPLSINSETFRNLEISEITLYVPDGTIEAYQDADFWNMFGEIVEYEYDFSSNEKAESQTLKAFTSNGNLYLSGLNPGNPLHIYNFTGQLIYKGIVKSEEEQIPLTSNGIYIVVVGEQSVKVLNYGNF